MQAHPNPREKTRDLWKNPCKSIYSWPVSWQLWYTVYTSYYSANPARFCEYRLHSKQTPRSMLHVSEYARIHVLLWWQMRDEFQGCNRHNVQKGIISHVSYFVYNIVSVGSGTCKQTFLPYAQNINCPRPRDIWYTFTLVDTTVFLKQKCQTNNQKSRTINQKKSDKWTIKKVNQKLIKRMQTKGVAIIGDQFRVDFT